MKGIFIPEITEEMFRNGCLESIETLMAEGKIYDIEYPLEQEQKKGHWIKYGPPRCEEQHYKCTSCGYYINFGKWGDFYTKEFKYCPNCSARMESGDAE